MKYLFYNVYGDAEHLVITAGSDVVCVPFGWDAKTEAKRNEIIKQIGLVPSCLPSVIYVSESEDAIEIRVCELAEPWSWEQIDTEISESVTE